MPRKRNPRRLALEITANAKRLAAGIAARWTVDGTVAEHPDKTVVDGVTHYGRTVWRKRTPAEYPENNAQDWAILFHMAQELEQHAQALKDLALENYRDLKESGR